MPVEDFETDPRPMNYDRDRARLEQHLAGIMGSAGACAFSGSNVAPVPIIDPLILRQPGCDFAIVARRLLRDGSVQRLLPVRVVKISEMTSRGLVVEDDHRREYRFEPITADLQKILCRWQRRQ